MTYAATPSKPKTPMSKAVVRALDAAEWKEADHPRADNGQFGSGGGGAAPAAKPEAKPAAKPAASPIQRAPHLQQRVESFREQIGPAATGNLNRNVTATPASTAPAAKRGKNTLPPEQKAIEDRFAAKLGMVQVGVDAEGRSVFKIADKDAYRRAVAGYAKLKDSEGGKVLNTDTARELSEDYLGDRTQSAAVHEPASELIKAMYAEKLAQGPEGDEAPMVLFTAGGTGAGKSSAIENIREVSDLKHHAQMVYDTNLNTYSSGKKKIEQALAAGKDVHIAMVVRDPEEALVNGALPRAERQRKQFGSGRTVPLKEHIKTHIGALETVSRLADDYAGHPNVHIDVIDNSLGRGNAQLKSVDWMRRVAYNDIDTRVRAALEREHEAGRISDDTYRGFSDKGASDQSLAGNGGQNQGGQGGDRSGNGGQPQPKRDGPGLPAGQTRQVAQAHDADTPAPIRGAGIAFETPQGEFLFLKRSGDGDHAGEWCLPGGAVEDGETAEDAAVRESMEEIGALPYGERRPMAQTACDGVEFTTFHQPILGAFKPRLNGEHSEHRWAKPGQAPEPLHPGVRKALGGMAMDRMPAFGADAWSEGDHPRATNGQFGSGGGSGGSGSKGEKAPKAPKASGLYAAPAGPGLTAAGDEDGTSEPKPGEKFIVYRLGSAGEDLSNRNAGNAQAVAGHIAQVQDPDRPTGSGGSGNVVTAYEVTVGGKFGEYGRFNAGRSSEGERGPGDGVGREAKNGSVLYAFPKGADFTEKVVGSIPLSEVMASLKKDHGHQDFDESGTSLGSAHLRKMFSGVDTLADDYRRLAERYKATAADPKAPSRERTSAASMVKYYEDQVSRLDKLAQDDGERWITVNGGEGKGTPILISGGGVVVGGAGGNLNGKTLSPKSSSKPRESGGEQSSKIKDIAKALQNRNRNSAASISQMNKIASNPNPRLLMAAPTMNDGAPVVSDLAGSGVAKLTGHRDWVVTGKRELPVRYAVVEAGQLSASNRADGTKNEDYAKDPDKLVAINNGRTAAMVEAYSRGTADHYKDMIARAERVHGISGKAIRAMKAPVLVRLMDAADVDEHIGDESNSTQTLSLSAVEQAENDAGRFDPSAIEYSDDGTPTDASVRGFINAMPASEQQSLAPNGKPTKQAIDRMMAATFHAAYGDTELVGLMAQATDPESRNLISGMSRAAGLMAKLKDAGELDIRELVTGAAKQIINAVRSGVSIKKFLKQGDLLTNSAEDTIAALFAENARSAKAIGERLTAAAEFSYREAQKEGSDMFGDPIPKASRGEVLESMHA